MIRDIFCQMSAFGDITSIRPDADTVQSMITRFSAYGLIPTVFQENNLTLSPDPSLQKSETLTRLQMVALEKRINVMFASNRIDINRASTGLRSGVSDEDVNELLDILSAAAMGLSFTRIGLNTTSLLENPTAEMLGKIQPTLTLFDNPDELMLRVNQRRNIDFGDNLRENSNVVLILQKTMGQLLINDQPIPIDNSLVVQFDINTIPENPELRFFSEQTKAYMVSAEQLRQSLLSDLDS